MKMDDIYKLKYLAGITDRDGNKVKEDNGGSNISITGSEKGRIQRKKNRIPIRSIDMLPHRKHITLILNID